MQTSLSEDLGTTDFLSVARYPFLALIEMHSVCRRYTVEIACSKSDAGSESSESPGAPSRFSHAAAAFSPSRRREPRFPVCASYTLGGTNTGKEEEETSTHRPTRGPFNTQCLLLPSSPPPKIATARRTALRCDYYSTATNPASHSAIRYRAHSTGVTTLVARIRPDSFRPT